MTTASVEEAFRAWQKDMDHQLFKAMDSIFITNLKKAGIIVTECEEDEG